MGADLLLETCLKRLRLPTLTVNYRLFAQEAALLKLDLLILNEVGFVPFSKMGAELLFGLLTNRYERGSVLVTSNLDFASWTEIFGDPRLTAARLDRLTHRCHFIELLGDSFRFK